MYNATRSRIFSTSSGSGDTLNSSWRHGLSPKARQILPTVVWEIPCLSARPRVDQCVASAGALSNVSTMTASITSSPMVRAAPGRGASTSPSRPSLAKRCRHFDTVVGCTPSSTPISPLVPPSAHANTIRHRRAKACDDECRRAHRCRVLRSSPLSSISTVGRPRRATKAPSARGPTRQNAPQEPEFPITLLFRWNKFPGH